MTPTETQLPPFPRVSGETMASLFEAATKVANASTKTYLAGINALVEQQKVAQQASLEWISEVTNIQSDGREQLVESFDSVKGKLTDRAEEVTSLASRAGAEVVKSSRDAAASASRQQRSALTKEARPKTPARSRSTSRSASQSGPARWTSEAYESLTAAEINEKLTQVSQRELREVETYEKAHQSRQTVLDRVSALRGQEPAPGYDELNVQEIHKLLSAGDDKLSVSVRDYERTRKGREGVLQAADAKLSKS